MNLMARLGRASAPPTGSITQERAIQEGQPTGEQVRGRQSRTALPTSIRTAPATSPLSRSVAPVEPGPPGASRPNRPALRPRPVVNSQLKPLSNNPTSQELRRLVTGPPSGCLELRLDQSAQPT